MAHLLYTVTCAHTQSRSLCTLCFISHLLTVGQVKRSVSSCWSLAWVDSNPLWYREFFYVLGYILLDWFFPVVTPLTLVFLVRRGGVAEERLIVFQLFISAWGDAYWLHLKLCKLTSLWFSYERISRCKCFTLPAAMSMEQRGGEPRLAARCSGLFPPNVHALTSAFSCKRTTEPWVLTNKSML